MALWNFDKNFQNLKVSLIFKFRVGQYGDEKTGRTESNWWSYVDRQMSAYEPQSDHFPHA